jgi:hypothetical protein
MLLKKYRTLRAHHWATLQMYDAIVIVARLIPLFQDGSFVSSTALYADDQNKDEPISTRVLNLLFHGLAIKVIKK